MSMPCIRGGKECLGCMNCQPEPKVVTRCTECGHDIYEGDEVFKLEKGTYCELCVTHTVAGADDEQMSSADLEVHSRMEERAHIDFVGMTQQILNPGRC